MSGTSKTSKLFAVSLIASLLFISCGDAQEIELTTTTLAAESATTQLTAETTTGLSNEMFTLTSSALAAGEAMPVEFTCDGDSSSPPLSWTKGPEGTVGYAVVMHHIPGPGDSHWYWVAYGIDADTTAIETNGSAIATLGTNSVNGKNEYSPPCSKGPGEKVYTFSVFALSQQPEFASGADVSRDVLLAAIEKSVLATATLDVTYDRSGVSGVEAAPTPPATAESKE